MKKLITLLLALTMMVSLIACSNQNNNPSPASSDNKPVANEQQPNDDILSEGAGTSAAGCADVTPSKYQVFSEYTHDYLGLSYKLPQEIRDKLTSGEMWVYNDTQMKGELDFDYSMMFFNLAEKDNLAKDVFESDEDYEKWLTTTKRFGAITVISSDYLKENTIESITDCDENEEIGKSSDGKYVFYFSTNQVDGTTELFKTIKVTTFDPKPIPEMVPGTCYIFNIMDGDRK